MNPWIVVGLLLNIIVGVSMFGVDSFGLMKSSPGLDKLFVNPEGLLLFRVGMGLWYASLLASCVGALLIVLKKERLGGRLLFLGGAVFFPVGMIQCKGALLLLDQLREESFQFNLKLIVTNAALDSTVSRKMWVMLFDMGLGLVLSLGALGLVYYTNVQHFTRHLPTSVPKGVLSFAKPGAYSSSYIALGLVLLLSVYVLTLTVVMLAAKFSLVIVWKALMLAFLSGPLVPLAFAFGLALFLFGVAAFRRPLLQLHEHYFTLRPRLLGRRLYLLYKDVQQIEREGEKKIVLHIPATNGKNKVVVLPLENTDSRQKKQIFNTLNKRKEQQQRTLFV